MAAISIRFPDIHATTLWSFRSELVCKICRLASSQGLSLRMTPVSHSLAHLLIHDVCCCSWQESRGQEAQPSHWGAYKSSSPCSLSVCLAFLQCCASPGNHHLWWTPSVTWVYLVDPWPETLGVFFSWPADGRLSSATLCHLPAGTAEPQTAGPYWTYSSQTLSFLEETSSPGLKVCLTGACVVYVYFVFGYRNYHSGSNV